MEAYCVSSADVGCAILIPVGSTCSLRCYCYCCCTLGMKLTSNEDWKEELTPVDQALQNLRVVHQKVLVNVPRFFIITIIAIIVVVAMSYLAEPMFCS